MKTKQILLGFLILCLCLPLNSCYFTSKSTKAIVQGDSNIEPATNQSVTDYETVDIFMSDELPGTFSSLADFYMFANTGSRREEDYEGKNLKENIHWYPTIEKKALIKLEDLFGNKALLEDLVEISILYEKNSYLYELREMSIGIDYREYYKTNSWFDMEHSSYILVDDPESLRNGTIVDGAYVYITELNGKKVGLNSTKYGRTIFISYDCFYISIDVSKSLLNAEVKDAKYAEIIALFENGISTEAVQTLLQNIENAIPKDMSASRQ